MLGSSFSLTVSSALLTHERDQFRKPRCQVRRPAVRTLRAGDIERQFHLVKRVLQLGRRHRADHCLAFVADNLGNIAADNAIKATAAIWIAEALMRKRGSYDALKTRTVTYGAITRPGERREITVAVRAAGILPVAKPEPLDSGEGR